MLVKSSRYGACLDRKAPSRMMLIELGLCGPRPSHSSSSASKVSELLGWSQRLRPTMPDELASPFGYLSLADIRSSFGLSMPLAARTKVLPVTRWEVLSGS